MTGQAVTAELLAVVVAMVDGRPSVLTLGEPPRLPAGPLLPSHRSLQAATRTWVEEQTGRRLGYLEQLYTFADLDREGVGELRPISVSYLGLTTPGEEPGIGGWQDWYALLPWEDRRTDTRALDAFAPHLWRWAASDRALEAERRQRVAITFGLDGQRLAARPGAAALRAALRERARARSRRRSGAVRRRSWPPGTACSATTVACWPPASPGCGPRSATGPVVFELLSPTFTLRQLQDCVEALAGRAVHTQNFRRLIEQQALVEETGEVDADTGGRPARRYRFRRQVLQERSVAGTKLPTTRSR